MPQGDAVNAARAALRTLVDGEDSAVAFGERHYLGSRLVGVPVTILSTGHGEADPVANNSTAQGRQANRRVTITLPTS